MSWALYPLHQAAYPIDWKSTQVPWAYLPLVLVILPWIVGSVSLISGISTTSLAVYPGHIGIPTIPRDDLPK
jgi:hypothetical protein